MRLSRFRRAAREDPPPRLDYDALEALVVAHFGSKLSHFATNPDAQTMDGVLYDAIAFSCTIDAENGVFEGGIRLANGWIMTTLLGEKLSLSDDAESIRRSLSTIERYCRHRLTEEFLDAVDAASREHLA